MPELPSPTAGEISQGEFITVLEKARADLFRSCSDVPVYAVRGVFPGSWRSFLGLNGGGAPPTIRPRPVRHLVLCHTRTG